MKVCPYIESSFDILGKKWNGQLIHYFSLCENGTAHFSEIKKEFTKITPRALSLKLTELMEFDLIHKQVKGESPVVITYELTEKGWALAKALKPLQDWAKEYMDLEK